MIKDERQILKNSIKIFALGCIIISVVDLVFFKEINLIFGYGLGYGINVLTFLISTHFIDLLLQAKASKISMLSFTLRYLLFALGFYLAVKIPTIFNIFTVAIGYLSIRLTIYYLEFVRKEGDECI